MITLSRNIDQSISLDVPTAYESSFKYADCFVDIEMEIALSKMCKIDNTIDKVLTDIYFFMCFSMFCAN